MSLSYRVTQFWWNITAEPLPTHLRQEIDNYLSSAESELFGRFQESDQWHAYRVFNTLKEKGHSQSDLLTAALLHDVGKTKVNVSVWDRTLIVVADFFMPSKAKSWGQADVRNWKRPFVVRLQHAQWGAEMAQSDGYSTLTIYLIRRHQDPLPANPQSLADELLRFLQWADDLN